jgi:hypothetical protein
MAVGKNESRFLLSTKPAGRAEDKARDLHLRSRRSHANDRQSNTTMGTGVMTRTLCQASSVSSGNKLPACQKTKPEARDHRGDKLPACQKTKPEARGHRDDKLPACHYLLWGPRRLRYKRDAYSAHKQDAYSTDKQDAYSTDEQDAEERWGATRA